MAALSVREARTARHFRTSNPGAALAAALACLAARAADPYPFSYERVQVAEGVHAFIDAPGRAIVSGNTVAILGADGVLVVDTGHHPRLTRQVIADIRRLTPKPVLYVVNTHWHNDHVAGNAIYAEAFADAKFIAHAFTARMLDSDVRPYMGAQCHGFLRAQSAVLRDMVAKDVGGDGKPQTDERRAHPSEWAAVLRRIEAMPRD